MKFVGNQKKARVYDDVSDEYEQIVNSMPKTRKVAVDDIDQIAGGNVKYYFPGEGGQNHLDESDSDGSFKNFVERQKKVVYVTERKVLNIPPGPLKYAYIAYWSKFFDVST